MQNILENIVLKCSKNSCNEKFNGGSTNNKKKHEQVCKSENISYNCSALPSSSLAFTDIYKIKENSDIPKELDYAFAHFAKLKMVKNKSYSFELPSGGPRVKNIYIFFNKNVQSHKMLINDFMSIFFFH